jgi:hypothetical protein
VVDGFGGFGLVGAHVARAQSRQGMALHEGPDDKVELEHCEGVMGNEICFVGFVAFLVEKEREREREKEKEKGKEKVGRGSGVMRDMR